MTIENLQIEVQATSDQAVTRLEKLEGVLERIDALGHRTGFDKLYRKLKKIASLDFSGTAKGMDGISKSVDKLTRANSRMSTFAKTVKKVREEASATNEEFSKFSKTSSPLIDTLKSITFGSLASSLSGEGGGAAFPPGGQRRGEDHHRQNALLPHPPHGRRRLPAGQEHLSGSRRRQVSDRRIPPGDRRRSRTDG